MGGDVSGAALVLGFKHSVDLYTIGGAIYPYRQPMSINSGSLSTSSRTAARQQVDPLLGNLHKQSVFSFHRRGPLITEYSGGQECEVICKGERC